MSQSSFPAPSSTLPLTTTTTTSSDLNTLDALTTLFAPLSIKLLIYEQRPIRCLHLDRFIQVSFHDLDSATLHLINNEDQEHPEISYILDLLTDIHKINEQIDETTGKIFSFQYTYERFDVFLQFEIIPVEIHGLQNIQAFDFLLGQYALRPEFRMFSSVGGIEAGRGGEDEDMDERMKQRMMSQNRSSNVVARGLEGTGFVLRKILHSSGKFTGYAIRFLGKQYTHTIGSMNSPVPGQMNEKGETIASPPLDPTMVAKSKRRKEWASGFHSGARTATGAILYPVRWTGMQASKLARDQNASDQGNAGKIQQADDGTVKGFLYDTVAGMGNGLASVCKGVTEAFTEIGNAISDSAMYHATETHGEEYAQQITKNYVEASEEIGWASYKLLNVLTFGWQGLMVDAMVEGTMLSVALYDFLIGPVILQQYMNVLQVPHSRPTLMYVVLRPWSISFYKSANDFVRKPYKIVATAMLDTRPKLRILEEYAPDVALMLATATANSFNGGGDDVIVHPTVHDYRHLTAIELTDAEVEEIPYLEADPAENFHSNRDNIKTPDPKTETRFVEEQTIEEEEEEEYQMMESEGINYFVKSHSTSAPHSPHRLLDRELESPPIATAVVPAEPTRNTASTPTRSFTHFEQEEQEEPDRRSPAGVLSAASASFQKTRDSIQSILYGWNGGNQSHIELCTVDCSTYLLYPPKSSIETWHEELKASCLRVETIAKRKSGAEEFAMRRRLVRLPKKGLIHIRLKRFLQYSPKQRKLTAEEVAEVQKIDQDEEQLAEERKKLFIVENEDDEEESAVVLHNGEEDAEDGINIPLHNINHSYFTIGGEDEEATELEQKQALQDKAKATIAVDDEVEVPLKSNGYESFAKSEPEGGIEESFFQNSTDEYFPSTYEDFSPSFSLKPTKSRFSLTGAAEQFFSTTLGTAIDVQMVPVTYNGVHIINEEHSSARTSVLTVKEHLYQLQSRQLQLRNCLNAVELQHPNTQLKMAQISRHIELFTNLDQEKQIAEWEFKNWLGKVYDPEEEDEKNKRRKRRNQRKDSIEKGLQSLSPMATIPEEEDDDEDDDEGSSSKKKKESLFQLYIEPNEQQQESYIFGHQSSLLMTKDCQRIDFNVRGQSMMTTNKLGKGKLAIEDIRSLQSNQEHEVWIPILQATTNQQIGNLLVSVMIEPFDSAFAEVLKSEKENQLPAAILKAAASPEKERSEIKL